MPTHKADLSRLSLTQLAELTGRAKDTVSKLLRLAGLEPVARDGRSLYFVPRLALPVIYGIGTGLSLEAERARLANQQADAQAMKNAVTRGELLSVDETEATMVAVSTAIRAALLALESKLAPALDGAETIVQRAAVIREHVHEALSMLAALGDAAQAAAEQIPATGVGDGAVGDAATAKPKRKRVGRPGASSKSRGKRRGREVEDQPR